MIHRHSRKCCIQGRGTSEVFQFPSQASKSLIAQVTSLHRHTAKLTCDAVGVDSGKGFLLQLFPYKEMTLLGVTNSPPWNKTQHIGTQFTNE